MYKIVKSRFWFLLFVMLCEVVWIGAVQSAPSKQLVIKGDRAFPPYEFINDQGEPDGFNVELIHAVMKRVGMPYTLSLEYWPQVVEEFQAGKVDVITGIMYTNRRAEIFKFGAIHTFVYQDVVYREGHVPITELEDLEGLEIIVQDEAITQEILENMAVKTHIIVVPDLYTGLRMLSEGKHDVALCNEEMALSIIKKLELDNLEMSELDLPPDEYCFAGKSDSLLTVIDKAFYKLQREGEYDRIFNKWFSTPIHRIPYWIYITLGVLVIVVAISYLFIILLHRQVRKANNDVNEYVRKMRYVFNHSNILIWEFDVATRMLRLDFGDESLQEIISIEELLQERIIPSQREEVRMFMERLADRQEEDFTLQWEMLPQKNSENKDARYAIINGMPMRDANGRIIAYSGVRRDVTDLICTQNRLEHETQRALQADKLKSAFLANMSHEIRTPLNAIIGFSGLLQETDDPQERKEYSQIINTNNELLLNLINDILDLSRIESGEVTLYNEHFNLACYFEKLSASLQQRCVNPDVEFIVDKPYAECNVYLDRSRLAQICTNFTTNSIKHTQKGSIRIGYLYKDGGIWIYTQDTGNGIPADKQHLVFQRFEKLNPFVQGTGLGLSICKAIVDAYGGKIGFTSKEGKGSRFWAWLPCEAEIVC